MYHAFVRQQKSQNVFYLVPYQTLNLLYPVQPSEQHKKLVNTLHAIAMEFKMLRVVNIDSVRKIDQFFRQNPSELCMEF